MQILYISEVFTWQLCLPYTIHGGPKAAKNVHNFQAKAIVLTTKTAIHRESETVPDINTSLHLQNFWGNFYCNNVTHFKRTFYSQQYFILHFQFWTHGIKKFEIPGALSTVFWFHTKNPSVSFITFITRIFCICLGW